MLVYPTDDSPTDDEKSFEDYREAAIHGDADAQHTLGDLYLAGDGVSEDDERAVFWYRQAAEQGLMYAQSALGYMYLNGDGVTQDYEKAVFWYRQAAEQVLTDAQDALGYMYENGLGVDQDYVQAAQWLRRAAQQGDDHALHDLERLYVQGLAAPLGPTEIENWYKEAAARGDPHSLVGLARMHAFGLGVPADRKKAEALLPRISLIDKHGIVAFVALVAFIAAPFAISVFDAPISRALERAGDRPIVYTLVAIVLLYGAISIGKSRHSSLDSTALGIWLPGSGDISITACIGLRLASWLFVTTSTVVGGAFLVAIVTPFDIRDHQAEWMISISIIAYLRWLTSALLAHRIFTNALLRPYEEH